MPGGEVCRGHTTAVRLRRFDAGAAAIKLGLERDVPLDFATLPGLWLCALAAAGLQRAPGCGFDRRLYGGEIKTAVS